MAKGIRTGDPCGFNKGYSSKFHEGPRVQQIPEEGRGRNNNEDNSLKTLTDKNHHAPSQKFRQLTTFVGYLMPDTL